LMTEGQRGAPKGWYKVVVNAVERTEADSANPGLPKSLVSSKYGDVKTTDILVEVKSGAPDGAYDLKLSPPGPSDTPSGTPKMPGVK